MSLEIYQLVSYSNDDNYINGARFSLTVSEVKLIINHLKFVNKWTESYFYDYGDYSFSAEELYDILNLRFPFWMDTSLLFQLDGGRITYEMEMTNRYHNNEDWLCVCGKYNGSASVSHLFMLTEELFFTYSKILKNKLEKPILLKQADINFLNKKENHYTFDTVHYKYYLLKLPMKDLAVESDQNWMKFEA
jgi:hypothetical protein